MMIPVLIVRESVQCTEPNELLISLSWPSA